MLAVLSRSYNPLYPLLIIFCECIFLFVLALCFSGVLAGSVFVHAFRENSSTCIVALFAAAFCLLVSYPGNLYSDSYGRIGLAQRLKTIVGGVLEGKPLPVSFWLTVTPSYFLAFFYYLTGNIAAFTFVQAFAFFYVTLLLLQKLCPRYRFFACLLVICNPLFFCVSIYHETGIGAVIGMEIFLLLLDADVPRMGLFDRIVVFFLLFFASFVTFGFRANALTVLPPLVAFFVLYQKELLGRILYLAALCGGILAVVLIPRALHIDTMSSVSAGFVWEMGTSIAYMSPDKQPEYLDYLDDLFGEGYTRRLSAYIGPMGKFNANICSMFELEGGAGADISRVGLRKIFAKYVGLYAKAPSDSLRTKGFFVAQVLGTGRWPLHLWEWDYDRWGRGAEFGLSDSFQRHIFMNLYEVAVTKTFFPLRPYAVLLLAVLAVCLRLRLCHVQLRDCPEWRLIVLAVFYYVAFAIDTQSMEFRYFYPAFFLLAMSVISSVAAAADAATACAARALSARSRG